MRITIEELQKSGCYGQKDLFDSMYRGMQAKIRIMRQYPDLGVFVVKAYYEKDSEIREDIQNSMAGHLAYRATAKLLNVDPEQFIPGIDLQMMYKEMYWASEGYLWEKLQCGEINIDEMEQDFMKLIEFWKSIYLRKEV